MELKEEDNQWIIQLNDARINYIHIDFRLTLDVVEGIEKTITHITIETPCKLKDGNSEILLIPENAPTLSPILPFFNIKVAQIIMQKIGCLIIKFSNGPVLEVNPDKAYEAWQVRWLGHLLICSPGGSIAFFKQP